MVFSLTNEKKDPTARRIGVLPTIGLAAAALVLCVSGTALAQTSSAFGDAPVKMEGMTPDPGSDLSHLDLPPLRMVKGLIPNLHLVSPNLLRGAQPDYQALSLLKQAGVKTIVNLRNEEFNVMREAAQAQSLGLNYVNIPLDVFTKPSDAAVQTFLATAINPANQPIYVHCLHGEDRTGTMCAIFRITQQNWPLDKAYQEMVSLGFKPMFSQLSQVVYEYGNGAKSNCPITPATLLVDDVRNRVNKMKNK